MVLARKKQYFEFYPAFHPKDFAKKKKKKNKLVPLMVQCLQMLIFYFEGGVGQDKMRNNGFLKV